MNESTPPDAVSPAPSPAPGPSARARRRIRSGHEVRQRRRRFVSWALFAGATVLMVNALVGENGYLAGLRASRERAALANEVTRLRLENQQFKEQARRLKDDPTAVEDAARRELGLIRPGETLVIIRDSRPKTQ